MITYGVSVIILWNENRSSIFQFIGSLTWTLFALYVINLIWPPLWMMSILGLTSFYPHEESHEGLRATVLQSQTCSKVA